MQQRLTKEQLAALSDAQLKALTDDEFWDAIEPGLCPDCDDARPVQEARRAQCERAAKLRQTRSSSSSPRVSWRFF